MIYSGKKTPEMLNITSRNGNNVLVLFISQAMLEPVHI